MTYQLKHSKNKFNLLNSYSDGFTLIELAIVMVIFGLILTAFLTPLSTQREIKARSETQVLLNQAKEALIGYAVVNRYLPCPDADSIPDGIENRNPAGTCVQPEGILPWATLGIDNVDAWDHYFRYRVDGTFSNSNQLFTISDAEGKSTIQVNGEDGLSLVSANSRPVAIVVSYGANGYGAINTLKATPANQLPAPTSADELENTDSDATFVSHVPTPRNSANEFDDMLIWISPKVLINRMVTAGRLP